MHYSPFSSSVRRPASYSDRLLSRHGRSQTTFWPTSRSSPETAVGRISVRCLLLLIVRAPLGTALAAIVPRAVEDSHGSGGLREPQRAKCAPARQVRAPRGQVGSSSSSSSRIDHCRRHGRSTRAVAHVERGVGHHDRNGDDHGDNDNECGGGGGGGLAAHGRYGCENLGLV